MTGPVTPKVNQIPALLLTGFPGAGKTTLLRALLSGADPADTAGIVHEFGGIGLVPHLLVGATDTTYLPATCCVCCTRREDLEASLEELFWARRRREIPAFSRVVVETTGLADPGRVLRMVTGDTLAGARYNWCSVVTLIDGLTGAETLEPGGDVADDGRGLRRQVVGVEPLSRRVLVDLAADEYHLAGAHAVLVGQVLGQSQWPSGQTKLRSAMTLSRVR